MKFYLVNHDDGKGLLYSEEAKYNLFIDEKEILNWNYNDNPDAVAQGLTYYPLASPVPLKDVIEILDSKYEEFTVVTATENVSGTYDIGEYFELKRANFKDKLKGLEFSADSQDRMDLRNIVQDQLSSTFLYQEIK